MSRKHWPQAWSRDFQALLSFHNVTAVENAQSVILLNNAGIAFAVVPISIELSALQATLSVMLESFDMGLQYGRSALQAQLRELLGVKQPD